jgi:hypothetical protein
VSLAKDGTSTLPWRVSCRNTFCRKTRIRTKAKKQGKDAKRIVVAEDDKHQLICTTEGFDYIPDTMRYVYGKSTRPPLEDWFFTEYDFFDPDIPDMIYLLWAQAAYFARIL